MVIKWIADFEKSCIVTNFEKRGWVKGSAGNYILHSRVLMMLIFQMIGTFIGQMLDHSEH